MIPRFDYSFSLRDAWDSLKSLMRTRRSGTAFFQRLFPQSRVYEIPSARLGIRYALLALELKQGARIGVQPYTCSSVMAAITAAGFRPVFIDINADLTLDCDDLKKKISSLDALIVTHTFGIPAAIRQLKEIAGHLPIIEDCAHAFLSRYETKPLGSFFDMAVFSFGNGKFPALGSGGLLVVNNKTYDQSIEAKIRALKQVSIVDELVFIGRRYVHSVLYSRIGYGLVYGALYQYIAPKNQRIQDGFPKEVMPFKSVQFMTEKKWKTFSDLALKQRQNALRIISANTQLFRGLYNTDSRSNCFAVVFTHEDRDHLYTHLLEQGIGAGKHFQYAAMWASAFGYENGTCPHFESIVGKVLTIPCSYLLREEDVAKINKALAIYTQREPS